MPIHVEVKDHIAVVTLDNPPVNAMAADWDIPGIFDYLSDDAEVRVAVLTAAGERAFCAGADLRGARTRDADDGDDDGRTRVRTPSGTGNRRVREMFYSIQECAVPVIGAINGPALGGGLAIAASCDYLIASEKATFGLPEIDVGLLGGARHFMRLLNNWGLVRRLHYTAERLDAHEALRLGMVVRVVPPDQLMEAAMADARLIASKIPLGVRLAKESLHLIENMDVKNGYRFEQTRTAILTKTDDAAEARRAFMERRPPRFTGG